MRLLKLIVFAVLLLSLSVVVFAHPGRTDSNGGHTDQDTGEYHYHHGYPAHQHSDLDGDGDLDCPYDFDDKTGSSGNKTGSSGSKTDTTKKDTVSPKETVSTKTKKSSSFWETILACVIVFFPLVLGFVGWVIDAIKKKFKKQ